MQALSPATAYADCKADEDSFKFCPEDLPDLPDVKLLCGKGCFLFHPDDEREARFNKERAELIPKLELALETLQKLNVVVEGQRDRFKHDVGKFRALAEEAISENASLATDLDKAPTKSDMIFSFLAGVAGGVVLAIGGAVVVLLL